MRSALGMLLVLLLLICAGACLAEGPVYFVAPSGNDASEGSEAAPLATLGEAMKRLAKNPSEEEAILCLREGTYALDKTIQFTYRGRGGVTVRAYPNETPVITGDTLVTAWEEVERLGKLVWRAPYEGKALRALYGEDGARQVARWPKSGALAVKEPAVKTESLFEKQRWFTIDPSLAPTSLQGAIMRMPHYWKDELSGVRTYDAKTGRVTLNRATSLSIFAGDRVWFENVLGAPLAPGEWAHDAKEGFLYYAPLPGEQMGNTSLYAGQLEQLLHIENVSGLRFEGITFARTGWNIPLRDVNPDFAQAAYDATAAIYIAGGKDVAFVDCTFRDIGAGCIKLDEGINGATIEGCTFQNIGAQAIFAQGPNTRDEAAMTRDLRIENNHIEGYGRNLLNAAAILLVNVHGASVSHNEVHDGYYTAISAGWVWGTGYNATDNIRIEENLLYDIGQGMLADMGAIYMLGVQPGTVIAGNVIHDVHAAEYGGWGIYLDEGASGITVERNLVFSCSAQGFHQHNGVYNTVRNNIFAYNVQGQVGMSDKRGAGSFLLDANLLVGKEPFFYRKYNVEKLDFGENVFWAEGSPFVDEVGTLTPEALAMLEKAGFIPWTYSAGLTEAVQ